MVRPAGYNETGLAWRFALRATNTPTVLALSRQGLPVWRPPSGAYVATYGAARPNAQAAAEILGLTTA